jgi:hypothetical protein
VVKFAEFTYDKRDEDSGGSDAKSSDFLSKEERRIHEGLPPKPNPDAEGTAASSKEHHD